VSVDPTVCAIKNNLWADGFNIQLAAPVTTDQNGDPTIVFKYNIPNPDGFVNRLISIIAPTSEIKNRKVLESVIKNTIQGLSTAPYSQVQITENVKEVAKLYLNKWRNENNIFPAVGTPSAEDIAKFGLTVEPNSANKSIKETYFYTVTPFNFIRLLSKAGISDDMIEKLLTKEGVKAAQGDPVQDAIDEIEKKNEELKDEAEKGAAGYKYLSKIEQPYWVDDDYNTELGINLYLVDPSISSIGYNIIENML
jgi:hypothetical protein